MPTSSTANSSPRNGSSRMLSDGTSISISAPQRKAPLPAATARGTSRSLNKQKNTYSRRETRNGRLSDRWPMLNKIMRGSKTAVLSSSSDDLDASNDCEEQGVVLICDCNSTHTTTSHFKERVVHPTSPRFPSPLSGVEPIYRESAARHNYVHRGLSHSALSHWREFWRQRKIEWEDYEYLLWQGGLTIEDAYTGMLDDDLRKEQELPAHLRSCPWKKNCSSSETEKPPIAPPLNSAIFPRLGDLSSLRDSFLISVDTWFSDFPLWTLQKLIWIYDINYRHARLVSDAPTCTQGRLNNDFIEDFGAVDHLEVRSLSSLTGCSDTTLVNTGTEEFIEDAGLTSSSKAKDSDGHNSFNSAFGNCERPWETCWFNRWEILYHEVSLAADIAARSENYATSSNGSKEAARIIFTSPSLLHDPLLDANDSEETSVSIEIPPDSPSEMALAQTFNRVIPLEEEEEDYGDPISPSDSKLRPGALLDPISMFATAKSLEFDGGRSKEGYEEGDFNVTDIADKVGYNPESGKDISQLVLAMDHVKLSPVKTKETVQKIVVIAAYS